MFQFRGRAYTFSLSLELFSSAGIDTGSRFLLKVFSDFLDSPSGISFSAEPRAEPRGVLDAGSGTGVLGICAAGALSALVPEERFLVRAQDRDELARIFTEYNAQRNGLKPENFRARAAPMLTEEPDSSRWDLILTNIPAKAGLSVLGDFVSRSAALLAESGKVFLVAVNTLADFFREEITRAGILLKEERGKEHTVFVYRRNDKANPGPAKGPLIFDSAFPGSYPFYLRNKAEYTLEEISYTLETVQGAPGFDSPGGVIEAAAKLAVKIDLPAKLRAPAGGGTINALIHDAGQGHFALWLIRFFGAKKNAEKLSLVLSGRNVVALAAAKAALAAERAAHTREAIPAIDKVIPSADIFLDSPRPAAGGAETGFSLIAFFPETMPSGGAADPGESAWKGLDPIAANGAVLISAMTSAEAERFNRKKPRNWRRLNDIKKNGFRAAAFLKTSPPL